MPARRFSEKWFLFASCAALPLLCACNVIQPAGDNGISGIIEAGPTCPVVQPGMDCADRPITATVIVRFASTGFEATRFTSADDGTFQVTLAPGIYLLIPQPAGFPSTPQSQTVEVSMGTFTQVVIEYDTGIR